MTTTMQPTTPARRRTSPRKRVWMMMALAAVMMSACGPNAGTHQIDVVPTGYHFHIHQIGTSQIWLWHTAVCQGNTGCTMQRIEDSARGSGVWDFLGTTIIQSKPERFFDDDQDDWNGAFYGEVLPPNPSINNAAAFGCLSGYRNTVNLWSDGDWYGGYPPGNESWCYPGTPFTFPPA